jgi:hypothetical protein
MQFVKAHWISLLSGLLALVGIALAAVGMTRDQVVRKMSQRLEVAREVSSLINDAQNDETINAERELGRKFEQEYEAVLRTAESINDRKPLLEGVFPRPKQLADQYQFRQVYVRKLWDLPRELKAGWLPSEQEVQDEAEILADKARRKAEQEGEAAEGPGTPLAPTPGFPPAPGPTPPGLPPGYGRGGGRMTPTLPGRAGTVRGVPGAGMVRPGVQQGAGRGGPPGAAAGQGLPAGVQADEAQHRAAVRKARNIRIYASPESSFHVSPIAYSNDAPTPRDMWYAQVSLWVQQDLVTAIARVNEEAAQQLGEKEAHVANLPVKQIVSIQVMGYVTPGGFLVPFPSGTTPQAAPAGSPEGAQTGPTVASFTGRKSDEQFDVIRLSLTVIVDRREVLKLIDSITRSNFYQLVGAEYTATDSVDPAGYFYGPKPVIRAVLEFEGYLARKLYKAMMPDDVLKDLQPASPEGQGQ